MITTDQIKALRDETGVSVMQCKKALEEAGGDREKALVILRKKSGEVAAKKSDRAFGSGVIASYVHNGAVGAMVHLSCETDFVAKNEEFQKLGYNIAMQVAATSPEFLKREDVTEAAAAAAKAVFEKEVADKPTALQEKILTGKLDAYFKDKILLEQAFIKDADTTIGGLIEAGVQKFGERIEVTRFVRLSINDA